MCLHLLWYHVEPTKRNWDMPPCTCTYSDDKLMSKQTPPNKICCLLTYVDSSYSSSFTTSLLLYQPTWVPNSGKSYMKDKNIAPPWPMWMQMASLMATRSSEKVKCRKSCLSAHRAMWYTSGTNPWAQRHPKALLFVKATKVPSTVAGSSLFQRSTQWIHEMCV